jgi:hypothetical protein
MTLAGIKGDRVRDPDVIGAAIAGQLAAARWLDSGQTWADIAAAHLARLRAPGTTREAAREAILQAEAALRRSLARKPANPHAWAQLAQIHLALGRDGAQIGDALRLSVLTGPVEPHLLLPRCRLALAAWPKLDHTARALFGRQFALALLRDDGSFARMVLGAGRAEEVYRSLGPDRPKQGRFVEAVERVRPGWWPRGE